MNDLAEKALHSLDVARKQVRDRPMLSVGVLGLAISGVVVVAGGRVGAGEPTRPLTTWLGLEESYGAAPHGRWPGSLMLIGILTLIALWLLVIEVVRRTEQRESRVWWVAGAWAVPFAVGPPLMDTNVYTYAAFGLLQRAGHDPYHAVPTRLGATPVVAAIDPGARAVPSSAGPLGTVLQHLSVSISSGSALGAVLILRVVAILAVIWIGRLAADMGGSRPAEALTLTVLNPLVLIYLVSGAHLEGVMIALVLAAITAANLRRWPAAVAFAALAGSVLAQGFVAVPIVIAVHWFGRRTAARAARWRSFGRDVLVAVGTTAALGLLVPDGFGWVRTVTKQFSVHTPYAVASAVAKLMTPIVHGASFDDLAAGGRVTALTAAACACAYLIVTARHRALERTVAYALLSVALLAPVLNPWYLLWGTLCLAPTALGWRRTWVIALSVAGCLLPPPGFSSVVSNALTGIALTAIALVLGVMYVLERRRDRAADETAAAEESEAVEESETVEETATVETSDAVETSEVTGDGDGGAGGQPPAGQRPPAISRTAGRTSAR